MDSYLRKVIYPQAHDNYRVIWKDDGTEIGSIGIQHGSGATEYWAWAIDTVSHSFPCTFPTRSLA